MAGKQLLTRRATARFARLQRTLQLLTAFPDEQKNPARFYSLLADDTAELLTVLNQDRLGDPSATLEGLTVLDVGGGPGFFADAFARRGATYIAVEPDHSEMTGHGLKTRRTVRATGQQLPFASDSIDIVFSSNVIEHTDQPWEMCDEMLRVTKPGGMMVYSYTVWLGPFGGHETGLWPHYVSGEYARDRYRRKNGKNPKNVFGESLFAVSCREGLDYAETLTPHRVTAVFPRYHPWWAWWIVTVPLLREFLTSNLLVAVDVRKPALPQAHQ